MFLQEVMSTSSVPGSFLGHTFRIVAATLAAQQGVPDHLIKTLGCWASDSYQLHIRMPVHTINGCSRPSD